MIILEQHVGLTCKVNVMRLEKSEELLLDPKFPFTIVGVAKNNRALIVFANKPQEVFSVAGFNIALNKGEWRIKKQRMGLLGL